MLVLNRKVGEAIVIDGGIRMVVLSVDKRGVRLGFEAPAATGILREELVVEVAQANRRAAAAGAAPAWLDQLRPADAPPPTTTDDPPAR
jgi:carbon storage regulator